MKNVLICLIYTCISAPSLVAQPGSPDFSFGTNGHVILAAVPQTQESLTDMVLMDDGRILVAGTRGTDSSSKIFITRLLSDGTPDISFAQNSTRILSLSAWGQTCRKIHSLPDGSILISGTITQSVSGQSPDTDLLLLKLLPSGSLDTDFGTGGIIILDLGPPAASGVVMAEQVDMIVQPEGPIVVLNRNQLIQFDANGTRNTAFGINGVGELPSTLYSLQLNTMTRQPDGYILVGGSLNGYFCLLRYLPSGLLDSTFHAYLIGNQPSPGRPLPDQHDNIYDIIVQPDGSITAVGYTSYWNDIKTVYFSSLLRFTSNGLPDISFGYNGITAVSASFIGWYYFEADIQPDLVFTGASITGGQLRLTRTQPDGAQDTVFGNNGEVIHNLGPYFRPGKVLITAEEKILVGGIQWNGHDDDIIVARFNGGASVALDDPSSFSGLQLFPNPATSDVTLQYTLHTAEAVAVWLVGYDGRKVADLEPAHWQAPGLHTLSLRLPPLLTSGYYFIACSIGDTRQYIPFQKE